MSGPQPVVSILDAPRLRRTLRDHVSDTECIIDTIEGLDAEDLDDGAREDLSRRLIEAIAGTRAKVDRTAAVIAMYEHLEAAAEAEILRLKSRQERFEKHRQRLEDYVIATLTASGLDRLDGDTATLALRKNPPRLDIDENAEIPHEFRFYPPVPEPRPDKDAIKRALKAGRKIAGCRLVQGVRLERS